MFVEDEGEEDSLDEVEEESAIVVLRIRLLLLVFGRIIVQDEDNDNNDNMMKISRQDIIDEGGIMLSKKVHGTKILLNSRRSVWSDE
jgi:hypothetical protein